MLIACSLTADEAVLAHQAGDFHWTRDRELLTLPVSLCSTASARARCGCGRSFTGAASQRATTVAVVHDEPLPRVRQEFQTGALCRHWARMLAPEALWQRQVVALSAAITRTGAAAGDLIRLDTQPRGSTARRAGALSDFTH